MRTLVVVMVGLFLTGAANAQGGSADSQGYRAQLVSQSVHQEWRYSEHTNHAYPQGSRLDTLFNSNLNAGVCDGLADATPGLQLMCKAFCEVQACSPDFTLDNPFEHCTKSSKWIYERYEARRGAGDPDMPCVAAPETSTECPCWTQEELAGFRGLQSGDRPSCTLNLDAASAGIANLDSWRIFSNDSRSYVTALTSTGTDMDGVSSCQLADKVCDPLTGVCSKNTSRYMEVTAEQLAACEVDIALSAADRGLNCVDVSQ